MLSYKRTRELECETKHNHLNSMCIIYNHELCITVKYSNVTGVCVAYPDFHKRGILCSCIFLLVAWSSASRPKRKGGNDAAKLWVNFSKMTPCANKYVLRQCLISCMDNRYGYMVSKWMNGTMSQGRTQVLLKTQSSDSLNMARVYQDYSGLWVTLGTRTEVIN